MADSKENTQPTPKPEPPKESSLTSISGSLAATFIQKNIESGGKPEFPNPDTKTEKKQ